MVTGLIALNIVSNNVACSIRKLCVVDNKTICVELIDL